MARTSMEQKAVEKARRVGREIGMNEFAVTGRLMAIWRHSQDEGLEAVSRKWIVNCCLFDVRRKNLKDAFIGALTAHRFLEKIGDDAYRIKGNAKHIANLVAYKKKTKPARDAKAKKSLIDKFNQKSVHQTELTDTKFVVLDETREVIHSADSKALPVAEIDEKNSQEFFEKSSVDSLLTVSFSSVDSLQEQVLCANESESDYCFSKKEKEEKLIEASTDFVYEQKMPDANVGNENQAKVDNASASEDSYFDDACHKFRERFEWRVGRKIDAGQNARLRYSQVIKSGVSHSQVLIMIDNYADAKFSEYPGRDGFFPIHSTFERFLGFPGDWHCKKYLTPIAIVDRSKLERNAQSKASADLAEEARLARAEKRKSKREFRLTDNLELKAKIRERIEATEKMKQKAQSERKSAGLSGTGFESAGDILNRMNLKF